MFTVSSSRSFVLVQCLLIIGHLNAASISTTNPVTEETTPDPPKQLPWKRALTMAIENLTRLLGKIDLQVKGESIKTSPHTAHAQSAHLTLQETTLSVITLLEYMEIVLSLS